MIDFLKTTPLFQGMGLKELESILPLLKIRTYEKDALILQEGERGDSFYLIKTGSVEILKKDPSGTSSHPVGALSVHDWFGEMAFLGEGVRNSSVKALEPVEAIAIPTSIFLKQAETHPAFSKIAINFAKKISSHLQQANARTVQVIEKQLSLTKTHDQISKLLVYLFILLTLFFYAVRITQEFQLPAWLNNSIASMLIVVIGIWSGILVKQSHQPLEFYGLTLKNGWKHAKQAVLWTTPLLGTMLVLKWALVTFVSKFEHLSLIGTSSKSTFILSLFDASKIQQQQEEFWVTLALYVALVPIQEFVARGLLQSCLCNFFTSSHRVLLSIVTSNLLFGVFHGFKSISFSLVAALLGLFWGWLYYRQRSLVGPIVSHTLIGAWGFGVLNFQHILTF